MTRYADIPAPDLQTRRLMDLGASLTAAFTNIDTYTASTVTILATLTSQLSALTDIVNSLDTGGTYTSELAAIKDNLTFLPATATSATDSYLHP